MLLDLHQSAGGLLRIVAVPAQASAQAGLIVKCLSRVVTQVYRNVIHIPGNRNDLVRPAQRDLIASWRYPMRAAEGGKEVVKSRFVGDIHSSELQNRLPFFLVEQVIRAHRNVE